MAGSWPPLVTGGASTDPWGLRATSSASLDSGHRSGPIGTHRSTHCPDRCTTHRGVPGNSAVRGPGAGPHPRGTMPTSAGDPSTGRHTRLSTDSGPALPVTGGIGRAGHHANCLLRGWRVVSTACAGHDACRNHGCTALYRIVERVDCQRGSSRPDVIGLLAPPFCQARDGEVRAPAGASDRTDAPRTIAAWPVHGDRSIGCLARENIAGDSNNLFDVAAGEGERRSNLDRCVVRSTLTDKDSGAAIGIQRS